MKTRVSLSSKAQHLISKGALRTFSLSEAIEVAQDTPRQEIEQHYANGRTLYQYTPFAEDAQFVKITQLNSFKGFIDLLYSVTKPIS